MKILNVQLKSIRVTSFYPKEEQVEFLVTFDDGKLHQFHKAVRIQDPKSLANRILLEITSMEKSKNVEFNGETILDSYVNVVIDKEKEVKKKMTKFFLDVLTRVENVSKFKEATGYMDAVNKVRMMRVEF